MSLTWEEIVRTVAVRRTNDSNLIRRMLETRDRYHADVVIPLRDVDGEPLVPPLSPQVIHDGIEHNAMRAASQVPTVAIPALDHLKDVGKNSREYADIRRRAVRANWHYNMMPLLSARWFRQLVAYGTSTMVIVPDFQDERARIEMRNSLNTYPDPRAMEDYRPPSNSAFVYGRSAGFLKHCYGTQVQELLGTHPDGDGLWDLCEWIDENDIVVGILGPRSALGLEVTNQTFGGMELRRWPNRANGIVPVATGKRITLDRVAGQMEVITGTADWLDRLMALNVLAAERNVFPDMYALSEDNREVELSGGEWQDGRTGQINVLANTKAVGQLISQVGPTTQVVIQQLERAARTTGGAIAQFGGEAPGGLRTGRAIDTLGAFSIDPRIAELQHVTEAAFSRTVNPAIMEIEKGYWPTKKYVVFSGSVSDDYVTYVPEKHFEATENAVIYPFPGMDISTVSVSLLQLVGGDMMSKRTARTKHPLIDDADAERGAIVQERLQEAALIGVQQEMQQGRMPIIDAANIMKYVSQGESVQDAIIKADNDARNRQATTPPPAPPDMAAAPQSMPGLAAPGIGAEGATAPEGAPQLQGPLPSQEHLRNFLRTLRAS